MKKIFSLLTLEFVHVGHRRVGKNWHYKNYAQNFIKIYFIRKGKGIIRYHDKDIILEKDKLYFVPPFKSADYFTTEPPLEQYWVHFYAKFENNLSLLSLMDFHNFVKSKSPEVITHLFKRLHNIYNAPDPGMAFEADAILRYLIVQLKQDSIKNPDIIMRSIKRFEPVVNYINKNCSEKIALKKMASLVNLHPTYFSNAFTKVFGMSPIEFAISKKIEQAQKLLFFTDKMIKEIAAETGFTDEFYFSRMFTKYVGMSPTKYRIRKKI